MCTEVHATRMVSDALSAIMGPAHMHHHHVAGDRPFLLSGADDRLAKVWDYQTKACVQTLEGHAHNVSAVMFHPELPVILTGCGASSRRPSYCRRLPA